MVNEISRIGIRVKAMRKCFHLSQKQLAELSGVGYVTISRIERGEDCKMSVVEKLEKAFGVTLY